MERGLKKLRAPSLPSRAYGRFHRAQSTATPLDAASIPQHANPLVERICLGDEPGYSSAVLGDDDRRTHFHFADKPTQF
jgi:hypothetical protein